MIRVLPVLVVVCLLFANSLLAQNPPTINCPGDIIVNLDPGACEEEVNFNVSANANGNPNPPVIAQIDGTGYTSGSTFPIGTITLRFMATDTTTYMSDTCEFDVIVSAYEPPTNAIVVDDDLNISIPSTCEMFLMPSMVLEGNYGCYDDFVVDVENTGSNYIGPYYVGETITFTVTDTVSGNSGWGEALIEDKSGPYIENCDSVTLNCLQDVRPVSEGGDVQDPGFIDCHPFSIAYTDMLTNGDCADPYSTIIMRVWTVTDILGNSSSCNQVITVERTYLTDISPQCPPTFTVECVPGETPIMTPDSTGYPTATIDSTTFEITDGANSFCNVMSSYSDMIVPGCGASYKIIRSWTVLDWCLPIDFVDNPWTCTQIIEYKDTTIPVVIPPANMTASSNLPGCRARPVIPATAVSDCSDYSVFITTPVGPIAGNGGQVPAPGLPVGQHTIEVKVTDDCGNAVTSSFQLTVADQTQPTPVCDAHTVVALDDSGYAFANATSFDDGSTDNCCLDGFEVARQTDNCGNPANLTFRDYIEFCCADVGQVIPVTLRVWDCNGNSNTCNIEVEVQDIHGPQITCPPDVSLVCGDDYNDPAVVGTIVTDPAQQGPNDGLVTDNCGSTLTIISSDDGQISCGSGTIYRTYVATDPANVSSLCVQTITVENNNPVTGASIVFPADITVYSCDAATEPDSTGSPALPPPSSCYQLVDGHSDLMLNAGNACRKILRTWTVIDWCQYDPNDPDTEGIWEQTQTITVMDQEGPTFPVCDNLTFCNFKDDCSDLAPDLTVAATDICTPDNQLTYSWTVDLHNDSLTDPPGYNTGGSGQNTTNNYPVGTHRITYTAYDGCGNQGSCSFLFTIEDCKAPTAACKNGLIVEIMQSGMVPVNASALAEPPTGDNCTDYADLQFSFSTVVTDTQIIYTCDDIGQNTVQMWVTDNAGNQDYCETFIAVQDNMNACDDPLIALNGSIANEENTGVENVSVELNGNMTSITSTGTGGVYQFDNVPTGYDYTVTPQLNDDPLNGVTTFDMFLIHRHILGIQNLDSPYKIIAADVNHSGMVTISDIVDLRKLVLHMESDFPSNTSWRFVDGSHIFPDPNDPFTPAFPEVCNVNDLSPVSPATDFVAVKIGDVNGSAAASFTAGGEERTGGEPWALRTADRLLKAGETTMVEFTADLSGLVGYQFTLDFDSDKIKVMDLLPGDKSTVLNYGMAMVEEGVITTSWHQLASAASVPQSDPVFSLVVSANEDVLLSELFSVNSRYTHAESYNAAGEISPVALIFDENDAAVSGFELYQNVPNPFRNATTIGFQLPEASNASLTVYDLSGKVIKEIKGRFTSGYHEVSISNEMFQGRGVYYYRLETAGHTATMKMIML